MKIKILSLLLLIPIFFMIVIFTTVKHVSLPIEKEVEKIVLEHDLKEAVNLNEPYKLYAHAVPEIVESKLIWRVSDESVAVIEEGYLKPLKEGIIDVYVSLEDGRLEKSFKAYVFKKSDKPSYLIVNNPKDSKEGLDDTYYFGAYDLVDGKKKPAKLKLDVSLIPYNFKQEFIYDVKTKNAHVNSNGEIIIEKPGKVVVEISSKNYDYLKETYEFNAVLEGVNVYNYDDLIKVTNKSEQGEIAVMQTNLESKENLYYENRKLKNTELYGYYDEKYDRFSYDYETFTSTYDTAYLDNLNLDKTLIRGINFKKDVYGNGFTINAHNLCYPSKLINENGVLKPLPSSFDLFNGPKAFVNVIGFMISGQDNVGFAVTKDNVTLNNLKLMNCNYVSNLTHLDYVGTVLEVMANNVTIKNSVISNGRNVVRSFSSENLKIEKSLLQYAREFILKLGSNKTLKPKTGLALPSESKYYDFLSPIPKNENGEVLSDSSCEIKDTYFYKSGFFSIGLDTHFAGELLYEGKFAGQDLSSAGIYNLAGTSYKTKLTLVGDNRFYDWKTIDELDTSTLVTVTTPGMDSAKYFDLATMILNKGQKLGNVLVKENNKTYVHGGIAFFGGGRNLSEVTFKDSIINDYVYFEACLDDPDFGGASSVLIHAAGYGPFKFYLYDNLTKHYFLEKPDLNDL